MSNVYQPNVIIISKSVKSNHYAAHLKLIQCYMSITSQYNWKATSATTKSLVREGVTNSAARLIAANKMQNQPNTGPSEVLSS